MLSSPICSACGRETQRLGQPPLPVEQHDEDGYAGPDNGGDQVGAPIRPAPLTGRPRQAPPSALMTHPSTS